MAIPSEIYIDDQKYYAYATVEEAIAAVLALIESYETTEEPAVEEPRNDEEAPRNDEEAPRNDEEAPEVELV